MSFVDIEKLPI